MISVSICNSRITEQIKDSRFELDHYIHGEGSLRSSADDLAAIEVEFERGTVSEVSAITDIGSYLRAGGGKRIRPALLLLSSKAHGLYAGALSG